MATMQWTILTGAAIVCAVFIVVLLVAHLARRFRREQRGLPDLNAAPNPEETQVRSSKR